MASEDTGNSTICSTHLPAIRNENIKVFICSFQQLIPHPSKIPGWSRASWWSRCTCQQASRRLSSSPLYFSTSFTIGSISSTVKLSEEQHNTIWASWCLNVLATRLFVQQSHQLKVTKWWWVTKGTIFSIEVFSYKGPIGHKCALGQMMAWRPKGDSPLPEAATTKIPETICGDWNH